MVMIRIHASYGDKISPIGMHKSFQCLDTLGLLKMLLLLPLLLQSVSFPMKLLLLESLLQLLILTRTFAQPRPRHTLGPCRLLKMLLLLLLLPLLQSLLQLLILTRPFVHPCPRQTLKTRPLILQLLVRVRIIHTH